MCLVVRVFARLSTSNAKVNFFLGKNYLDFIIVFETIPQILHLFRILEHCVLRVYYNTLHLFQFGLLQYIHNP